MGELNLGSSGYPGVTVSANQAQCRGILQGASDARPVQNMGVTVEAKNEPGDISRFRQ